MVCGFSIDKASSAGPVDAFPLQVIFPLWGGGDQLAAHMIPLCWVVLLHLYGTSMDELLDAGQKARVLPLGPGRAGPAGEVWLLRSLAHSQLHFVKSHM